MPKLLPSITLSLSFTAFMMFSFPIVFSKCMIVQQNRVYAW